MLEEEEYMVRGQHRPLTLTSLLGCVIPLTVSDEEASQHIQLEIERFERSIPNWVQNP